MVCIHDKLLFSLIKDVILIYLIYNHMDNLEDVIVSEAGYIKDR